MEDKFLVQLAPIPPDTDLAAITDAKDKDTMAELNRLWSGVPKGNMVQFKLKVQKRRETAAIVGDNKNLATSTLQAQPTVYGDAVQDGAIGSSVYQSSAKGASGNDE